MSVRDRGALFDDERRALARSDRLYGLLARVWAPVIGVYVLVELVTTAADQRPVVVVITLATVGAVALSALSVGRISAARGFGLVSIVLDVIAIVTGAATTSGNDAGLFLPFLGSVLLVPFMSGRRLVLVFVANWAVGVVAATLAYAFGPLLEVSGGQPDMVGIVASAILGGIGYASLWWVGDRLAGALRAARTAEARALAAEEEARHGVHDREALIASSPVATIAINPAGRIETWNAAAERVLGWAAEEAVGRSWQSFISGEDTTQIEARVAAAFAGSVAPGTRSTVRHRDGTDVQVEVHLAARRVPGAGSSGVVCQLIDVGERELLQARLVDVARLEAVGQLAGGIAHDFNNLMTAVSGYAELLRADPGLDRAHRDDLDEITRAARRGANLVRQLLTFSRQQPVTPAVVDLPSLVGGITPMLERLIGAEVTIEVTPPPEPLPVLVDPAQAEQVLINLVVNARDAMPGGGRLAIGMQALETDGSGIGPTADLPAGAYAELTVTDSGCGMDASTLAHIFEPFFTTKPAGTGTGLGLATASGVVRDAGGAIWATSVPEVGSTFHVLLPRVVVPPAAGARKVEAANPLGRGETVLVVDDEEPVREFVRRALGRMGYRVLVADGPTDALLKAAAHDGVIDLLLTDVVMPEMRGPTLAASISAGRPAIRTLYMSGFTPDRALLGRDAARPESFLAKPFPIAVLAEAVRAALDAAPAARRPF